MLASRSIWTSSASAQAECCTTLHMYWSTSSPSNRAGLLQYHNTFSTTINSCSYYLLAHRTFPEPLLAVEFQVGLQVEALYVATVVAAGGEAYTAEGEWTAQRHLLARLLYRVAGPRLSLLKQLFQ